MSSCLATFWSHNVLYFSLESKGGWIWGEPLTGLLTMHDGIMPSGIIDCKLEPANRDQRNVFHGLLSRQQINSSAARKEERQGREQGIAEASLVVDTLVIGHACSRC